MATRAGHVGQLAGDWLGPIVLLMAATIALLSDGALFHESSQLVAVVGVLGLGLVLTVRDWNRVFPLAGSRLGLLVVVNGVVLVISAMLSVYHWASIRELLKAAALAEAFLLGATLIDRANLRDRFLVMFYWWGVAMAGAGSILYPGGHALAAELAGELRRADAGDTQRTVSARSSGMPMPSPRSCWLPIALGVALAWHGGKRGTAALVGLVVPLVAMQLAASRWGYVVLGLVLVAMLIMGLRLARRGGFTRMRAATVTGVVLVLTVVSMLVPVSTISSSARHRRALHRHRCRGPQHGPRDVEHRRPHRDDHETPCATVPRIPCSAVVPGRIRARTSGSEAPTSSLPIPTHRPCSG